MSNYIHNIFIHYSDVVVCYTNEPEVVGYLHSLLITDARTKHQQKTRREKERDTYIHIEMQHLEIQHALSNIWTMNGIVTVQSGVIWIVTGFNWPMVALGSQKSSLVFSIKGFFLLIIILD
jgi:hypothetical protein